MHTKKSAGINEFQECHDLVNRFLSIDGKETPQECKDALFHVVTSLVLADPSGVDEDQISWMVSLFGLIDEINNLSVTRNHW